MKTYRVPVFYEMYGWMEVEAESKQEAETKVMDELPLPDNAEYVDGSFNIDHEAWEESLMQDEDEDEIDAAVKFLQDSEANTFRSI